MVSALKTEKLHLSAPDTKPPRFSDLWHYKTLCPLFLFWQLLYNVSKLKNSRSTQKKPRDQNAYLYLCK